MLLAALTEEREFALCSKLNYHTMKAPLACYFSVKFQVDKAYSIMLEHWLSFAGVCAVSLCVHQMEKWAGIIYGVHLSISLINFICFFIWLYSAKLYACLVFILKT